MKNISIVVPVYNEEKNLPELANKLEEVLDSLGKSYECIFVDDGSSDDSHKILKELQTRIASIKIIKLRKNFGQTAAMVAGFDHAEGEVIITIDADLQNDPEDIPVLFAKMDEGFDIVSGWRNKRQDKFLSRKVPSFVANKIIAWLTGVKLHDFGCTLKAYRKSAIKDVRLYGDMHRFIPAIASYSGVTIGELRVKHHRRKYGTSKYGIARTLKVLLDLVTVKFFLSYSTSPMQIFGLFGIFILFLGVCAGTATIIMKGINHIDMTGNPLLYLTILLFVTGVQFMLMGILGEIMTRTYHESQSKQVYTIAQID